MIFISGYNKLFSASLEANSSVYFFEAIELWLI